MLGFIACVKCLDLSRVLNACCIVVTYISLMFALVKHSSCVFSISLFIVPFIIVSVSL